MRMALVLVPFGGPCVHSSRETNEECSPLLPALSALVSFVALAPRVEGVAPALVAESVATASERLAAFRAPVAARAR